EVPDPLTATIHLNKPWPGLGDHLADKGLPATVMVSKKYVESVGEQAAGRDLVGTGPFEYTSRIPGTSISGKALSQYWGTPPGVADVTLKFVPEDATRLAGLRAGEMDIIALPRALMDGPVREGYTKVSTPVGQVVIWMNLGGQQPSAPRGPNNPLA